MSNSRAITSVAALVCAAGLASGQYFQYEVGSFEDEQSFSVAQTTDAGSITVGYRKVQQGPGGLYTKDFYIVKHDKNGQIQWQRLWGGQADDTAYAVRQTMDGGYIIAGETGSFEQNMELVLLRLDHNGQFLWAKAYPHQAAGDTIHFPHPGVALNLSVNQEIVVTGHFMGHPTVLFTDPNGFPVWHHQFFVPPIGIVNEPELAFTDVAIDHQEFSLVTSGTIRFREPNDPNTVRHDATLFKIAWPGFPVWFFTYDWPFDRDTPDNPNVGEYGHGVDVRPDGFIVSTGKTDFGRPNWDMGVFTILADPGGLPHNMMRFQPIDHDGIMMFGAPAYAAIRFDHRFFTNIITGSVTRPDTMVNNAFLFHTDPMVMPIWSFAYGDQPTQPPPINVWPTWGESVAIADLTCGWIMAGRGEEWPNGLNFLFGDNYLVKTEDNGVAGCKERPIHMAPEMPGEFRPLPIEPIILQGLMELPNVLRPAPGIQLAWCFYPTCYTGPCNAADLAHIYGVLDLADLNAFINGFVNQQPIADLNGDGVWDLRDIQIFIADFVAGCP